MTAPHDSSGQEGTGRALDRARRLVVLVRGAPGSGKSIAAENLVNGRAVGAICEVDAFRRMLARVDWTSRSHHAVALKAAADAASAFALDDRGPVAMVDCFGRSSATETCATLRGRGLPTLTVSLWAEPGILKARLASRANDYSDVELALLMNEEVRTTRVDDVLIDTSAMTPEQVAARIASLVACEGTP